MPSPVAQYAMDKGFSPELVFTPERAVEVSSIQRNCIFSFNLVDSVAYATLC